MSREDGPGRVKAIALQLKAGETASQLTVREFLSWFGAKRRGYWVVSEIRRTLEENSVETDPDFESTYIDGSIQLKLAAPYTALLPTVAVLLGDAKIGSLVSSGTLTSVADFPDPTHRISKLLAANSPPLCVAPDSPINEAVTLMLARGFSQLPVTTTLREVKGVISW